MKKITYSVAFAATLFASSNTFAQQGFGTNTPDRSAAVEIKSSNKGLLIPRIALSNDTQRLGVVANAESLLVYNTAEVSAVTEITEGNTVLTAALTPGYYYWNGSKWIAFATGNSVADLSGENAITRVGNKFRLGGSLMEDTSINLNAFDLSFDLNADSNLKISGLKDVSVVVNDTLLPSDSGYVRPNINFLVASKDSEDANTIYEYTPDRLLRDYLIGKNGVTVREVNGVGGTEVVLGGSINEPTNFNIVQGGSISVTGLRRMDGTSVEEGITSDDSVRALGNGHLIPVGGTFNGQLKVATAKEIVDAGITSVENVFTSTTYGDDGTISRQGTLVTKVNQDESAPINIGEIVRNEQNKTAVAVTGNILSVTPTTNQDITTYTIGINSSQLVAAGIQANNGLSKTDNLIQLGGELSKPTIIKTNTTTSTTIGEGEEQTTLTTVNTLAIEGLQNANLGSHKNLTVDKDGVLRTTERVLNIAEMSTSYTLLNTTSINEEVNISFKLEVPNGSTTESLRDAIFTLPAASIENKGQVVNVKLSGDTNEKRFLVIKVVDETITEGSMPYQSWVIKSNGEQWNIVATK